MNEKEKKNDYKEQIKQLKEQKIMAIVKKNVINTKIDKINKKLIYVKRKYKST